MKDQLHRPEHADDLKTFKQGIEATLKDEGVDCNSWQELANTSFKDEQDWRSYVQALYAYIFFDGNHPDKRT